MKITTKLIITSLLLIITYTEFAFADTQAGAIGRKKSKAGGADIYQVTCSNDGRGEPDHLYVEVKDLRPKNPAQLGIQATVTTTGAASAMAKDAKDGDYYASPGTTIQGGAGPYQMTVTKTRSSLIGAEIYLAVFHCETADGTHTGTSWERVQNQ